MDLWAVANGMSSKSVPRRNKNGRSKSRISGEVISDRLIGKCTECVDLWVTWECSPEAADCKDGSAKTSFTGWLSLCVSPLYSVTECFQNELMDGITLVVGIENTHGLRSMDSLSPRLICLHSLQNIQPVKSRDWVLNIAPTLKVTC